MAVSYKVIGRHKEKDKQPSWRTGRPLTQAKKRVYVSEADFLRYSPELIARYKKFYYVEIYMLSELDGWVKLSDQPSNP